MSLRGSVYDSREELFLAMDSGHDLALVVATGSPRRLWPFVLTGKPAFIRAEHETLWLGDSDLGETVCALVVHVGVSTSKGGIHIEEAMLLYRADDALPTLNPEGVS